MNASDIVKAKQNRTLYTAYYRPTIIPGNAISTVTLYPISTVSTGGTYVSSFTSCITTNYLYKCNEPIIDYQLANDINNGKYICGFPACSTITEWNTGATRVTGVCDCKISFLTWKNTTPTLIYNYSTISYSTVSTFSTTILTGPGPIICPLVDFYQGTNFDNNCNNCNANNNCNC